jgi:hypothetical protein
LASRRLVPTLSSAVMPSRKENSMKLMISIVSIIFALSSLAFANGPFDIPDQFMKQLIAGKGAEAVDQYFSTNPLAAQKTQQTQFIKTQIDAAFNIFGKPTSYELAIEDDLAPSLKRYVFITKHEYHALTWEFYVYKPKDIWIASNMTFSDNFGPLEKKK